MCVRGFELASIELSACFTEQHIRSNQGFPNPVLRCLGFDWSWRSFCHHLRWRRWGHGCWRGSAWRRTSGCSRQNFARFDLLCGYYHYIPPSGLERHLIGLLDKDSSGEAISISQMENERLCPKGFNRENPRRDAKPTETRRQTTKVLALGHRWLKWPRTGREGHRRSCGAFRPIQISGRRPGPSRPDACLHSHESAEW